MLEKDLQASWQQLVVQYCLQNDLQARPGECSDEADDFKGRASNSLDVALRHGQCPMVLFKASVQKLAKTWEMSSDLSH
eukprot:CAMPEP_0114679102 /NCGR_PEP_ID=MMETSP0191-20121206/52537_1 /TAXON_ID=126664 /ORGANISM="Sorites sp." /LENGTH=78 /DNA_ID=CAMNT_0001954039 /DNA_START=348 /DNA_END=584 /DNA_ORIENTATION=-